MATLQIKIKFSLPHAHGHDESSLLLTGLSLKVSRLSTLISLFINLFSLSSLRSLCSLVSRVDFKIPLFYFETNKVLYIKTFLHFIESNPGCCCHCLILTPHLTSPLHFVSTMGLLNLLALAS